MGTTTATAIFRTLGMVGAGGGVSVAAAYHPAILIVLGAGGATLVVALVLGVLLPAIWSRKPARRKAAAAVLGQVLTAIRPSAAPPAPPGRTSS